MVSRGRIREAFLLGLFAWVGVSAAKADGLGLGRPDVLKLTWDTRGLTVEDVDGDSRMDLAVINNEAARIEVFYQRAAGEALQRTQRRASGRHWEPVLEDGRFERDSILTGGVAFDLTLGDLNRDGRKDLIYTNDRDELVIHWRTADAGWSDRVVHEMEGLASSTGGLWVGNLHGDEGNDLVCLTRNAVMVFPDGALDRSPVRYGCALKSPQGLIVADVNGDQRLDLSYFYLDWEGQSVWAVRLQSDGGKFVSERHWEFERMNALPVPVNWGDGDSGAALVSISAANQSLRKMNLVEKQAEAGARAFDRVAHAIPGADQAACHYAVADWNEDGRLDVVASDREGAQVWYFAQSESGAFGAPESFPAFAKMDGLAASDVDGDGCPELVLLSRAEGVVGLARFTSEGRFTYPEVIPLPGIPQLVTVGDVDGDGSSEVIASSETQSRREHALFVMRLREDRWQVGPLVADTVASRAQGLRVADVNQDGREDVLILSEVQSLEILLQREGGEFVKAPVVAAGLAEKVAPESLVLGDLNGDGLKELVVARETFARVGHLGAEGRVKVAEQINAPRASARIEAALVIDADEGESRELVLVDVEAKELHVMGADDKGVYRRLRSFPGVGELVDSFVGDVDADGDEDLLLFGPSQFWWCPQVEARWMVQSSHLHETDLKEVQYGAVLAGRLNGDTQDDLLVIDHAQTHVMELLLFGEDGGSGRKESPMMSALHFKLFEADPHFKGPRGSRFQPHDAVLADLNGDGLTDVAVLIHDRLIIYPQRQERGGADEDD